jgi:hypothetical protein
MVVRTDGRVAIGTNQIDGYNAVANTLVISTAADTGITVVSTAANTGNLFFARDTTKHGQNAGFVSYDHSAQSLSIGAGSTTVAVVTAAGQVVIGAADPTKFDSDADQLIVASNGGAAGLTIAAAQGTFGLIDFANGTVTPNAGFIRYDMHRPRSGGDLVLAGVGGQSANRGLGHHRRQAGAGGTEAGHGHCPPSLYPLRGGHRCRACAHQHRAARGLLPRTGVTSGDRQCNAGDRRALGHSGSRTAI